MIENRPKQSQEEQYNMIFTQLLETYPSYYYIHLSPNSFFDTKHFVNMIESLYALSLKGQIESDVWRYDDDDVS